MSKPADKPTIAEPEEIRVMEVRRTIRSVQEDVKSERFVFHLVDGHWKFHTAGAYDFSVGDLEQALEQLKKLAATEETK